MRIVICLLSIAVISLVDCHKEHNGDNYFYGGNDAYLNDYENNYKEDNNYDIYTDSDKSDPRYYGYEDPELTGREALWGNAKHKSGFSLGGGIKASGKFIGYGHEDQGTKFEHIVRFRKARGTDKQGKPKHYDNYDSYGKVQNYGDKKIVAKFGLLGDLKAKGQYGMLGRTDLYGNMIGHGGYYDKKAYGYNDYQPTEKGNGYDYGNGQDNGYESGNGNDSDNGYTGGKNSDYDYTIEKNSYEYADDNGKYSKDYDYGNVDDGGYGYFDGKSSSGYNSRNANGYPKGYGIDIFDKAIESELKSAEKSKRNIKKNGIKKRGMKLRPYF